MTRPLWITKERVTDDTFVELIHRTAVPAYRLSYGMLHDHATAEDAVQDATLRAWRKFANVRPGSDPDPWFLAIVANCCRARLRSRWHQVITGIAMKKKDDARPTFENVADHDLRRAIGRLTYRLRLVVILHYYLDLPLEDVASVAKVPLGTVKSRLHRAISHLRADPVLEELFDE